MPTHDDILIVGGYGVVGRLIAERIAPQFAGRVLIGGRSQAQAEDACRVLGYGTRARVVDVEQPASVESSLAGVGTVMMCVAQHTSHMLHAAAERGLAYTDLSPRLAFWSGLTLLEASAQRSGARLLLGTGLSPGVSNVMARQLANELGAIDRIQTAILLSLGDHYGQDSLQHVFASLQQSFTLQEAGQSRQAQPFGEPAEVDFPAPLGSRVTYTFPWSDVVYYPRTLGVRSAIGRFALEPAWLGQVAGLMERLRLLHLLGHSSLGSSSALRWLKQRYSKRDAFGLVVEAEGGGRKRRMSLVGHRQAHVTAASAAEMLRMLATGQIGRAGLWFAEQVVPPAPFFAALSEAGWHVQSTP